MSGEEYHSGGCQCGAVRFRVNGPLGRATICHCRMCQKAFGNFFGPLVTAPEGRLTWTRGAPSHFQSSNHVRRGFCASCGTPLTYEHPRGVELAIGALDDPSVAVPKVQYSASTRIPYVADLANLPERSFGDASYLGDITSNQHPDHDT